MAGSLECMKRSVPKLAEVVDSTLAEDDDNRRGDMIGRRGHESWGNCMDPDT